MRKYLIDNKTVILSGASWSFIQEAQSKDLPCRSYLYKFSPFLADAQGLLCLDDSSNGAAEATVGLGWRGAGAGVSSIALDASVWEEMSR